MTEYWVSQAKFWCELCKCWLPDTQQARANHEKGSGHKIAVQRKLREMRKKAEQEKEEEDRTKKELKRIEKGAAKAYAKDQAQLVSKLTFNKCFTFWQQACCKS
jgi:WW domain-binding protein 4